MNSFNMWVNWNGIENVDAYLRRLIFEWFGLDDIELVEFDELLQIGRAAFWQASLQAKVEPTQAGSGFRSYITKAAYHRMQDAIRQARLQGMKWAPEKNAGRVRRFSEHSDEKPNFEESLEGGDADPVHTVWYNETLALVEAVLLDNSRKGQGERDLKVFGLWMEGKKADEIAAACSWLKDNNSVRKALERIVTRIREYFGVEVTLPISLDEKGRGNLRGITLCSKEYFAGYWESHKKEIRDRMREYMRTKRAAAKAAKPAPTHGGTGSSAPDP